MPYCDGCGENCNSVAVYVDDQDYLIDLCQDCGQGKTKKEDKISSDNEEAEEEDSPWESGSSSSSSSEEEELYSEGDDEIVPEEEDDEEDIVAVDDTTILPDREELLSQERRLEIQRLIKKEGYVINARHLASWYAQNIEVSNAMHGKGRYLNSDLAGLCFMFMSNVCLKPIIWNIIASFLVPEKPKYLSGRENEEEKARMLSHLRFYEMVWEPIRIMKGVLFTDNMVYYYDVGENKSVSLCLKDGLVKMKTIVLPTSNDFSFPNGPDELAKQDFRTGYSCGRDAMAEFSKHPPLVCRAAAHLVLSGMEDDGLVVNAVTQIPKASHKTMAILNLCSIVFRKYLQRLLPTSTNNMHRDHREYGSKRRTNDNQIRVYLWLPMPGCVCFNVDPVQGDHATFHDIFKTIQHDMGVYKIPLPFEMTGDGWIDWESLQDTCFKRHWRSCAVSKFEDDYSKWNPFEKETKVYEGSDISFYYSEDPPIGSVFISNLDGWENQRSFSFSVPVDRKLGDVTVGNCGALRNWSHPDEIAGLPLDTPIHDLKTRAFSLKTKPFRMSNRIVCIDEEEYDKKVLNDLKQFVKRFENVAMDVISIEEEYGTEHMYIRKPDNNFLALFVLFLELGINGDRGVYFTRHKDDFDYFKTKLGDLKFKHVDKRQYTATPEFFQEIIEGDVAFKWLVEHFGSIKSALKPFFQVIPYQVGDGNDKVFTYYTYLRRPFSKTSRLPRRNKPSYPTVYQIKTYRLHKYTQYEGKTIYVVPFYTNVSDDHGHSYQFDKIPIMRLNQSTRKCFPEKLEICLCGDSNDSARGKGWMVLDFGNHKFRLDGAKATWAKCERLLKLLILKKKRFPDCNLMGCFDPPGSVLKLPVNPLRSTAYFKEGVTKENFKYTHLNKLRGVDGFVRYGLAHILGLEFGCISPDIHRSSSYPDYIPTLNLSRRLLTKAMQEWKPVEFQIFMENNSRIRRERKKRNADGEPATTEVEVSVEAFAKKWFGPSTHPSAEEDDVIVVQTLTREEVVDRDFREATIIDVE